MVVVIPHCARRTRFLLSLLLLWPRTAGAGDGQAPGPLPGTYMAFGDSITEGSGSSDENGFRPLLEQALRERLGKATLVNEGVPGADTRAGVRRIEAALRRHRPAVTLILLGTNDWEEERGTPEGTVRRLRTIVRAVKSSGSLAVLSTLPPVNVGFDPNVPAARNAWVQNTNGLMREMAREEGAVLVDVHAALLAAGPTPALFSDGLHPNDRGYAVLAATLADALTGALAPAARPEASPRPSAR